jgi:hypothetical protein
MISVWFEGGDTPPAIVKRLFQPANQPSRFLTWLGIFVVLVAGSVQASHICGLGISDGQQHSVNTPGPVTSPTGICPICVSSQPATSTAPALASAPTMLPAVTLVAVPQSFHSSERQFALYTRPPPLH